MTSYKVFKPVDKIENVNITPQEIEKPNYPDAGVAFAGYSKTQIGNKEYRLNPQRKFDGTFHYVANSPGIKEFQIVLSNSPEGSKHYLKQIYFSSKLEDEGQILIFKDYSGNLIFASHCQKGIGVYSPIVFTEPIQTSSGILVVKPAYAVKTGDEFLINIYGWIE